MRSSTPENTARVLIAGGGVAAVEALLALRQLAGDRVSVEMLAPDPKFRYRPLSVTEPFGLGSMVELDLLEIALEHGATFMRDAVVAVDTDRRTVATAQGRTPAYDALLLAIGARGVEAVPGALTFRGSVDRDKMRDLLDELEGGTVRRLVFAVPAEIAWPLGLYELALLCAARVRQLGLEDVELALVTPESRPMEVFGPRASAAISSMLEQAGIAMHLACKPLAYEEGELTVAGQAALPCDHVVALPSLEVAVISGIPQERGGFVAVDRFGAVFGAERVYAAGDITTFPVKQGGIAAQMADSAASSIAAFAGAAVDPQPFQPVLRGAVLTESGPRFLRRAFTESRGEAARNALWWPPAKIAGRYLAPYLARRAGHRISKPRLEDLEATLGEDPTAVDPGREDIVAMALSSANIDAQTRDFPGALRWLEVVEDLQLYLPPGYESKRAAWIELAHHGRKSPA